MEHEIWLLIRSALRNIECPHWSGPMGSADDGKAGYCTDGKCCTCDLKEILAPFAQPQSGDATQNTK